MKRPIPQGLLVAVEGIDGAGKSSVATILGQWCGERGLGCVMSKEPTGMQWGTELRMSAKQGRLPIARELELFGLDRRDHVKRCIAPALLEGNIVILDRYYWSNAAYQGSRGMDYNAIVSSNEVFAPKPDLILLMDLDVDAGLERIKARGDRPNTFESKASLLQARNIFLQLAERNSDIAVVIDSSKHFKDTAADALAAFQKAALKKIATGPLHPEMVNLVITFFGGERVTEDYPEGTLEMTELLAEARRASQFLP